MTHTPTRRSLMCGATGLSIAAALAACSSSEPTDDASRPSVDPSNAEETGPATDPTSGGPAGDALTAASDVPVGSGMMLPGIVIVQPEEGVFRAFDPTCTHQGGVVDTPKDGVMTCALHGSQFAIADGSVLSPPAVIGLTEIPVVVTDGFVYRQ